MAETLELKTVMLRTKEHQIVIDEGFRVAEQFKNGAINKVEIDIGILQKILDDDLLRDMFVLAFNDEIGNK